MTSRNYVEHVSVHSETKLGMSNKQVHAGIDIGATNIKYGLVSPDGEVLYKDRKPAMVEKGAEPLLHLITNIAENLLFMAAEEGHEVRYLGVGTPGAVEIKTGKVIGPSPNIEGWQGTNLGSMLSERLNLPVKVDNDANTMALAENRFGAAVGYQTVICVTLGTGVGGGVIMNGRLWRGADGSAGEIGYLFIDSKAELSGQGGSLESYCNSKALLDRVRNRMTDGLTPAFEKILSGDISTLTVKRLFQAARNQDQVALDAIEETVQYLGIGLAGAVNLLNPEIVVIGGGIADGGLNFVDQVATVIKDHAFDSATRNLKVAKASLGNAAGFIGASVLGEDF